MTSLTHQIIYMIFYEPLEEIRLAWTAIGSQ